MLYITFSDGQYFNWHVGTPLGKIRNIQEVVEVQADGDELDHIESAFTGLPLAPKKRVVVWTGDFARFIVGNL